MSKKPRKKLPLWLRICCMVAIVGGGVGALASVVMDGESEPMPDYIGGIPVEEDARVPNSLWEEGWRLVKAIQRTDRPCDSLTRISTLWRGYEVTCNNDTYTYEVGPVTGTRAEYVRVAN